MASKKVRGKVAAHNAVTDYVYQMVDNFDGRGDSGAIGKASDSLIRYMANGFFEPCRATARVDMILRRVRCEIKTNQSELCACGRHATREDAAYAMATTRLFPGVRIIIYNPNNDADNIIDMLENGGAGGFVAFGANEFEQFLRDNNLIHTMQKVDGTWGVNIQHFGAKMMADFETFAFENGTPFDEWMDELKGI